MTYREHIKGSGAPVKVTDPQLLLGVAARIKRAS